MNYCTDNFSTWQRYLISDWSKREALARFLGHIHCGYFSTEKRSVRRHFLFIYGRPEEAVFQPVMPRVSVVVLLDISIIKLYTSYVASSECNLCSRKLVSSVKECFFRSCGIKQRIFQFQIVVWWSLTFSLFVYIKTIKHGICWPLLLTCTYLWQIQDKKWR